MRVKFYYGIGYANADREEIFDFPDSTTEEELEEEFRDWASNFIDGGFWKLDEEESE